MLAARGRSSDGARVVVSGSGNVAVHAIGKVEQLGGTVVACSDSSGWVLDEAGIDLDLLREVKEVRRGRTEDHVGLRGGAARSTAGEGIWSVPCDVALPCATQNELDGADAKALVDSGCLVVAEGATVPCTPEAVEVLGAAGVASAPGKAADAGVVATSALGVQQPRGTRGASSTPRPAWPRSRAGCTTAAWPRRRSTAAPATTRPGPTWPGSCAWPTRCWRWA